MSKDIVIVPTYDRPEYLALCLEKLNHADGIDGKIVWVCQDNHGHSPIDDGTMTTVLCRVNANNKDRFKWFKRSAHPYYGNSYNVLEAFREAYATDARYVYLVEDDVLVMPDFFKWHEAVQQEFHPFVSCAGRINRSLNFAMNGPEAIDETCRDPKACVASGKAYGSWAACFDRERLYWITKHADHESWRSGFEQDIFIQDFMWDARSFSVWPYVPRAYHLGMNSYHRNCGLKFNGTLEEKIKALRSTISSPLKIKEMALMQDDIDPYPTQPVPEWSGSLYLKSDYRGKR